MAQLDLSKLNIPVQDMPDQQTLFASGGKQWDALGKLLGDAGQIAGDLYTKQRDVETDQLANTKAAEYKANNVLKSEEIKMSIDPSTGLSNITKKDYSTSINENRAELKKKHLNDFKNDSLARQKYLRYVEPSEIDMQVNDVLEQVKQTKEFRTITNEKFDSNSADRINLADSTKVDAQYELTQERIKGEFKLNAKVFGLSQAAIIRDKSLKSALTSKLENNLRNADSENIQESSAALNSASKSIGTTLRFKDFETYKRVVQEHIAEIDVSTPEGQEAATELFADLTGPEAKKLYNSPPDINSELFTSEEKTKNLNSFLNLKIKNAKAKSISSKKYISDWVANKDESYSDSQQSVNNIVNDPNFNLKDRGALIGSVVDGFNSRFLGKAKKDYLNSGGKSQKDWKEVYDQEKATQLPGLLNAANISKEEYDNFKIQFPATADSVVTRNNMFDKLDSERIQYQKDMDLDPIKMAYESDSFVTARKNLSITKKDGTMINNPAGWVSYGKLVKNTLLSIPNANAKDSAMRKFLPDSFVESEVKRIQDLPPKERMAQYQAISAAGPDLAVSFYKTAVEKYGLSVGEAQVYSQVSLDNTRHEQELQAKSLELLDNSKFGEARRKAMQDNLFVQENAWIGEGKKNGYDKIAPQIDLSIEENDLFKKFVKIASKSGMTADSISLYSNKINMKNIILEKMSKAGPLTGKLEDVVKEFTDKVIVEMLPKEYISTESINTVLPKGSKLDPKEVSANATSAITKVVQGLKTNNLKLDFSDARGKELAKRINATGTGLSDATLQSLMVKEYLKDMSFSTSDITARDGQLVLKSGENAPLKFITKDGGSALFQINPEDLAGDTLNKKMQEFTQPQSAIPMNVKSEYTPGSDGVVGITARPDSYPMNKPSDVNKPLPDSGYPMYRPKVEPIVMATPAQKEAAVVDGAFNFLSKPGRDEFKASSYRVRYADGKAGKETVGFGHEVTPSDIIRFKKDGMWDLKTNKAKFTKEYGKKIAMEDLAKVNTTLNQKIKNSKGGIKQLADMPDKMKSALLDMMFNVRVPSQEGTWALIEQGEYEKAGQNMKLLTKSLNEEMGGLKSRALDRASLFLEGLKEWKKGK